MQRVVDGGVAAMQNGVAAVSFWYGRSAGGLTVEPRVAAEGG
jgi:hypothetical protein